MLCKLNWVSMIFIHTHTHTSQPNINSNVMTKTLTTIKGIRQTVFMDEIKFTILNLTEEAPLECPEGSNE